jgi:hypothetical protein
MVFLGRRGLTSGAVGRLESRCMRLVVLLARTMARFSSCCRSTAGLLRPFVTARSERSRLPNGKTSHEALLPVGRFER